MFINWLIVWTQERTFVFSLISYARFILMQLFSELTSRVINFMEASYFFFIVVFYVGNNDILNIRCQRQIQVPVQLRLNLPSMGLSKKQLEQLGAFGTSLAVFGAASALFTVYWTDWKAVVAYIPYYNGKFNTKTAPAPAKCDQLFKIQTYLNATSSKIGRWSKYIKIQRGHACTRRNRDYKEIWKENGIIIMIGV